LGIRMNAKERRRRAGSALRVASDALSDEIWGKKWDHIADLHTRPIVD
jgi:hypothetical protein